MSDATFAKRWVRTNLGVILSYLGIALSAVFLCIVLVRVALRGDFHYVWANILPITYVSVWITLVTTVVRTIGWRILLRAFFMGFFAMVALTYPLNRAMKIPFGENNFTIAVWVPIVEEVVRLGLLLFMWWIINRRSARRSGITDMVIIGAVLSLGLGFHEDMLYPRSYSSFTNPSFFGGFTEPWGAVFPTAITFLGDQSLGHLSGGIGIGAAVGLLFAFKNKYRAIGIALAASLWIYETVLHGLWNFYGLPNWIGSIAFPTSPWIHIAIIVGAIVFDLLRKRAHAPQTLEPSLRYYRVAHANAESPVRWLERIMALSRYRREWIGYANARAVDAQIPDARTDSRLLNLFLLGTRPKRVTESTTTAH